MHAGVVSNAIILKGFPHGTSLGSPQTWISSYSSVLPSLALLLSSFFFFSSSVFSGCNINVLFNLRVPILTQQTPSPPAPSNMTHRRYAAMCGTKLLWRGSDDYTRRQLDEAASDKLYMHRLPACSSDRSKSAGPLISSNYRQDEGVLEDEGEDSSLATCQFKPHTTA